MSHQPQPLDLCGWQPSEAPFDFLLKAIFFPSSTCNNIVHVDFTINSRYIFTSSYCCSAFMRVCMYDCISETQARERVVVPGPWLDSLCRVCEKSRSSRSLRAAWGRSPTAKRPQRHISLRIFFLNSTFLQQRSDSTAGLPCWSTGAQC